jgi:hypothetical protein
MMNRIEWIEHWVYEVVDVARLPVPNELRDPDCMIGPWVWVRRRLRRLVPWLIPRQGPRECCWHHQIDWRRAADAAVRLVREAQDAGFSSAEIGRYVMDVVTNDELLDEREELGVLFLVGDGVGIQVADPDATWLYQDGQHRVAAQLDQGVRQTIIQRLELLDPTTGQPIPD